MKVAIDDRDSNGEFAQIADARRAALRGLVNR
jgi:hypothetical protein